MNGLVQEKAVYEAGVQNASIAASGSEIFFSRQIDKEATQKYGSFNNVEIVNDSAQTIKIELDGLSTRARILFAKSTLVIKAEQGIYYNNIKVTNQSSTTAIGANEVFLIGRIVRR